MFSNFDATAQAVRNFIVHLSCAHLLCIIILYYITRPLANTTTMKYDDDEYAQEGNFW